MPTVYVISTPTATRRGEVPDLSGLEQYGDVRFIFPRGVLPFHDPDEKLAFISDQLTDFDPTSDYLAWAGGDTLSAVMVGVVLSELEISAFNWLRFERKRDPEGWLIDGSGIYRSYRIPLEDAPDPNQLDMFTHDKAR